MTINKQPDKRKHDRAPFTGEVIVAFVIESKDMDRSLEVPSSGVTARALDVSEGGLRLHFGPNHSPTDMVKVKFNLEKTKTVDAYAKRVWVIGTTCGFQYLALDQEARGHIRGYVKANKG